MILIIVAVRDRAADAFSRPYFVPSVGLAVRSFQDELNRNAPDNIMAQHPDDFDLYKIGEFDDATGCIKPLEHPEQVAIGKQLRLPLQ